MTTQELKEELKRYHITYAELSESANIPIGTLKNIFSKQGRNPRLDTVNLIEKGIEKIKISKGFAPSDIEDFERISKGSELARKISELPPDKQDELFALFEQMIEIAKK